MKLDVLDMNGSARGEINLNPEIFAQPLRSDILHRVVLWQRAKKRTGLHHAKGRSEVSGSTRKIYSQKGSGRARHGAIRAAQFRGGGVIFGPQIRSHEFKLNKKVRKLGLKIALSLKLQMNEIIIVSEINLPQCRASALSKCLQCLGSMRALIIDAVVEKNLALSVSNLPGYNVLPVIGMNVFDLLRHKNILLTVNALKGIEARLL